MELSIETVGDKLTCKLSVIAAALRPEDFLLTFRVNKDQARALRDALSAELD